MERASSKRPTPKDKANVTAILPAKYGAKWLEPSKGTLSRKSQAHSELSRSFPSETMDDHHRRATSAYAKQQMNGTSALKSYKSVDETLKSDVTDDEGNTGTGIKSVHETARFYEHFQEPNFHRPIISARNSKPRSKPPLPDSSSADSLRSSGYSSFDIPKPYAKPKPYIQSLKSEMSNSNKRPQSENSFFDMVKGHKDDLKKNDQRSPASKSMAKVLGQGLDSGKGTHHSTDLKSKSDKSESLGEEPCAALKCWSLERDRPRQSFAHHDWQSMIFSFSDVLTAMETLKRKNEATGASKAAALSARKQNDTATLAATQDGFIDLQMSGSDEEFRCNDVLAWCPYFVNEIGGAVNSVVTPGSDISSCSQTPSVSVQLLLTENSSHSVTNSPTTAQMLLVNNKGVSVTEKIGIDDDKRLNAVGFIQEHLDNGALYYRKHFYEQDHQNYFGIDEKYGPVAISIKREKLKEANANAKESIWNYRVIVRTCELCTLRGSVLEDVLLAQHYSTARALKPRDILEYSCPEINFDCLKCATPTDVVQKQLMKVDEQNVANIFKIGVMYCKKDQTTEEEMYNNEFGSPGFEEFLDLLGDKVQLKGFDKFRGGLDVKTNSTGKESYFTTFQGSEIMFHVSTLLPYTTNNVQQLLRKRHIGNDIVTIVFQEPDSPPFSADNIRSQFQHVFIIIRVHEPCSSKTCYRVAVTRSQDIPSFGPSIPADALFPKSETFRDFLLTKLLNGERAARGAGKFKAMAMNTRQEYLRDLAVNHTLQTGLDGGQRFTTKFSLTAASRRVIDRDKSKNKLSPEEFSQGSLVWNVVMQDCTTEGVSCMLGISDYMFLLVRKATNRIIFCIPCQAIIGWAEFSDDVLHIYYGRGERIAIRASACPSCDWMREVKLRLQTFSIGCETKTKTLKRNIRGQLGFHINYEGIVMDVEAGGYAHGIGLTQGSRLVEICKVLVVTMTHAEMLDLLRTSDVVTVIMISPLEDGTPRRCSKSLYHVSKVLKMVEINSDSKYTSSEDDTVLHARSRSDPSSRRKLNKSLEDITQALAQSLNLKRNNRSIGDWNQGSSSSAASTPAGTYKRSLAKYPARHVNSLDPAVPQKFRTRFNDADGYPESRLSHTARPNHFTTIPTKKNLEKSMLGTGGMKHSTSTESGLNLNLFDDDRSNGQTRMKRTQNINLPLQSASASNTPATTPISDKVFPYKFVAKQPQSENRNQQLFRPKPYRPVQVDPILSSIHPRNNYGIASKRKSDKFNARSSLLYSSSAESGFDGNVDEVRASKTPSRQKKHLMNGVVQSENRKGRVQTTRAYPSYAGSPPLEPRRLSSSHRIKLTRALSDESICGIVQNKRWRDESDYELSHEVGETTLTSFAESWDRAAFRPIDVQEDSRTSMESAQAEDVYHSCASDYCSDDNEFDMTADGTSRPRSAVSISPILPDFTSSEEGYGQMSRLQSDSDADIRLRKIEDALKSLQSQLAKEQRSKRRILKEVEKLRKDNQRLQKQAAQNQKRDMTYA